MNIIHRVISFLHYLWRAKTIFYIHSPFVYQFYKTILTHQDKKTTTIIAEKRKLIALSNNQLLIKDFGTGINRQMTVGELASKVAIRPKYGQVLYQLTSIYQPKTILEIGTSIGISSSYLALGNKNGSVHCLEGSEAPLQLAKEMHQLFALTNTTYYLGDFSTTLPDLIQRLKVVDLVFFDGNHTREATLEYFNRCMDKVSPNSIFVFDDIYWSKDMTAAWNEIKKDSRVKLTIDLYQLGICFFMTDKIAKEDFTLLY